MKLLLYFSDGFAWKYWQETDFMEGFWKFHRPLETLLGYSSTIFPSMLSGKYPGETGIWTEYYYDPEPQKVINRIITSTPVLLWPLNLIRLVLFRFARLRGLPSAHRLRIPLQFSHLFKHNPIDYREFPPIELTVPTLDKVIRAKGLRFEVRFLDINPDIQTELNYLKSRVDSVDVFFYLEHALDAKGHKVGPFADKLKPEMNFNAQFLESAWDVIGGDAVGEMILFSDHGMTEVRSTFDLNHALRGFNLGEDYLVFTDSSFARLWFPNPEKREAIKAALIDAPGHFLTPEEQQWNGLVFSDHRYGQEILVADEGVVFHPNYISPSFFRNRKYAERGMHGYWPKYPSSYGIFAYRGSRLQADIGDPVPAVNIFTATLDILERAEAREPNTEMSEEVA